MGRIVVMNHVTLDGVMQAPGRPDEDTRGGFSHGGWAAPSGAAHDHAQPTGNVIAEAMGERMAAGGGLDGWLFGRRTYEDLLGYWNRQAGSPFGEMLNSAPKFVVSRKLEEPLRWPNSTLLRGEPAETVSALKARSSGVLAIMGSGELIAALMTADLIDEYLLMIHPLDLGLGRRLFPDGVHASLRLIDPVKTAGGVLIAAYAATGRDG